MPFELFHVNKFTNQESISLFWLGCYPEDFLLLQAQPSTHIPLWLQTAPQCVSLDQKNNIHLHGNLATIA